MIQNIALRWFVTALFVFVAAVCVRGVATNRHSTTNAISHSLHAVMAIAMALMAWPRGAELPTRAPMVFFAAAALWFAVITVRNDEYRVPNAYHSLMMLAMAWMYAAMGGLSLSKTPHSDPAGMDMAGMGGDGTSSGHAGHAGHGSHSAAAATTADTAAWIGVLNWICAAGFGLAAAFWLYRYITSRLQPADGPDQSLGILCQWAMATGMAIMFTVML